MLLLLDSSGPNLCCAVADGGRILAARCVRAASEEARELGQLCNALLAEAGGSEVSEVTAGCGPGSFIGTRVAVSFANGFAAARALQLRGFNSIAALLPLSAPAAGCASIRDARREQVYLHLPAQGPLHVELVERSALAERLANEGIMQLFLEQADDRPGRGVSLAAELLAVCGAAGIALEIVPGIDPARALLLLSSAEPRDYIEPLYLRSFL